MLTAAGWAVDRTLWHGSATNTLMSLSYLASDRGFSRAADFFRDAAERRRLRATGKALGILLGLLRQSGRSEEHTSELQSLMRISYAVFCLKKKKIITPASKTVETIQ